MEKMKQRSLITRILVLVIGIMSLMSFITFSVVSTMIYKELLLEYESKALAITKSIADSASEVILFSDGARIQSQLDHYLSIKGVAYLVLKDRDGQIIAHTFVPVVPNTLQTLYKSDAIDQTSTRFITLDGYGKIYEISEPILLGAVGTVHMGMELNPIYHSILKLIGSLVGLLVCIVGLFCWFFQRQLLRITTPLKKVSAYAQDLAGHHFESPLANRNDIVDIAENSHDEVGRLSETMIKLEASVIQYIQNLKQATMEKQRIQSELDIARDIQMGMLPKSSDMESLDTLKLATYLMPAREVGGDFYDYIEVKDDVYVVVGDVSGKGVSAAIFMAMTMMLLKAKAQEHVSPQEIMGSVNNQLIALNENMLFVTVFCAKINRYTGEMHYVNAGHPRPLLKRKGEVLELPITGGMALGVDPNHYYQESQMQLDSNDLLCIYTDGISEAMNTSSECYSEKRLLSLFSSLKSVEVNDVLDDVIKDVTRFSDGAEQSDDITLVTVSWSHAGQKIGAELGVHFKNELSEVAKLHQVVDLYVNANQITSSIANKLKLVLEELITNTIMYGYRDHNEHLINVFFSYSGSLLTVKIEDDGIPFNPLEAPEVDMSRSLEELDVGGLGIHIVKNFVDHIDYKREGNKNSITFQRGIGDHA